MTRPVRHQIIDRPDGTFCALVLFDPDRLYRCDGFGSWIEATEWVEGLHIIMEACGATVEPSDALDGTASASAPDLREWRL
ncbi:hypothetical protein [Methylobacterium sp. A54F]